MNQAKSRLGWVLGMASRAQLRKVSRAATAAVVDNFWMQLATLSRRQPFSQPHRHNVELIRDVPYLNSGSPDHQLDIYRPTSKPGPWPVVLYIHGGGFRILSKDSHWMMGLMFARRGYLVFNINYRLAPRHRYPSAPQDVCAAYRWVVRNAAAFGGDLSRLVIAGESAGANLALGLTMATVKEHPEPWAKQIYDLGVVPRAVVPFCGILQVSDVARFSRGRTPTRLQSLASDYMSLIADDYLPTPNDPETCLDFADPLTCFERGIKPSRPLPSFFIPVGTADPVLDDSQRLAATLKESGADVEARYYDGEWHAFFALLWKRAARLCWRDTFDFLAHRLEAARPVARPEAEVVPLSRAHLRST